MGRTCLTIGLMPRGRIRYCRLAVCSGAFGWSPGAFLKGRDTPFLRFLLSLPYTFNMTYLLCLHIFRSISCLSSLCVRSPLILVFPSYITGSNLPPVNPFSTPASRQSTSPEPLFPSAHLLLQLLSPRSTYYGHISKRSSESTVQIRLYSKTQPSYRMLFHDAGHPFRPDVSPSYTNHS
jgi:hypothetical protein